jgi:hypothetical protein
MCFENTSSLSEFSEKQWQTLNQREEHTMQDLRLLAIEQESIVLEGADGERFRLAIDESLRKAIRGDKQISIDAEGISPREIQELIRSGHAVEAIVARTGAAASYVEKFATPVLEELEHIIASARSVRLSFQGERYGETNHIEFGIFIRERLEQLGAKNVNWVAKRTETGGWQVACSFEIDSAKSEARWSFDIRHLSLSPENEVALNLAAVTPLDALVPHLKPVAAPTQVEPAPTAPKARNDIEPSPDAPLVGKNLTSSLGATQEFADVIPFGRGRNTTANVPVIAAGTSAEVDLDDDSDDFDQETDLLDGLRRRRDNRESKSSFTPILEVARTPQTESVADLEVEPEDDFDESTVWIDESDEVFVDDDSQSQEALSLAEAIQAEAETQANSQANSDEPAESPSTPPSKRGRATMPSWDEIVFGTRPDTKDD